MIIDDERLAQEQSLLNRLGVGLMAEGVQLTRIVPDSLSTESLDEGEQRIALASKLAAPMRVLPWMRRARLEPLVSALAKSAPDVIYAVGADAWDLARDLATAIERPLLLDVHALDLARTAARWQNQAAVGGYVAACVGIERTLKGYVDPGLVSLVPMGVMVPATARQSVGMPTASVAVLGAGRDVQSYAALFGGLHELVRDQGSIQIFLELRGPHEHDVWRLAERLDLLQVTSAVAHAAHYRALVTRCDLVLMPERNGELRSILLEAMALALPVIARQDSALDMLRHQETALIVQRADPGEWFEHLKRLLQDREHAAAIGMRARDVVLSQHRSSNQVSAMLEALERCRTGGAYAFGPTSPQV